MASVCSCPRRIFRKSQSKTDPTWWSTSTRRVQSGRAWIRTGGASPTWTSLCLTPAWPIRRTETQRLSEPLDQGEPHANNQRVIRDLAVGPSPFVGLTPLPDGLEALALISG